MIDSKNGGGKRTLIEDGTDFNGTLSSTCPIVVNGRVEGEVSGPSLHVSTTGSVSGKVKVKQIRSEGELSGEFDADEVQLSGRVKDATVIRARSLEAKLQPEKGRMEVVFGECELAVGDEISKDDAVAAAKAEAAAPAPSPDGDAADKPGDRASTDSDNGESKPRSRRSRNSAAPPT
jgi:cytoskeletal protein CcmA (bactofilin family)